jgi:hypothetical protein
MHQPTVEGLEDYLSGKSQSPRLKSFHEHVAVCQDCRDLVTALSEQSVFLRELRIPETVDPAPGFYARVMDRIDAQASFSLWSVFLEPVFGRRFMYAALSLLVVLGTAVMSNAGAFESPEPSPIEVSATPGLDADHDRAVVLVNLASYSGTSVMDVLPVTTSSR